MITDPIAINLFFVKLEGELVGCPTCGVVTSPQDRHRVPLVDLTMVGRQFVLVWNKRRFACREPDCPKGNWT